eukprot:gnl/TRDRNA2_/TRDRNA2_90741_c0_seq1.p1 gnl/TRDRNA2_/TRDRNA2_90741_c0~~gnl/TRDRNA2_/TRDRNA2_90741_c0_seq1.p1  ORF type:complete len:102 (+),score=13.05 gnl/TRDRNA2_/TRDRNA2_90741_c0_seq1:118-423(+)
MHGKGTYYYSKGGRYEGDWLKNVRHGEGTFFFANGEKYAGAYVDDKKHGKGLYTYADGTIYEGTWQEGNRVDGQVRGGASPSETSPLETNEAFNFDSLQVR